MEEMNSWKWAFFTLAFLQVFAAVLDWKARKRNRMADMYLGRFRKRCMEALNCIEKQDLEGYAKRLVQAKENLEQAMHLTGDRVKND